MNDPVKNMKWALYPLGDVSQWFGGNPQIYSVVNLAGHNGIDIVRPWGEPILAVEDGIVVDVKEDEGGYGRHVRIFNKQLTREWTYGHLSAENVTVGQQVIAGETIATMGNTGFTISGDVASWETGSNITTGTNRPGTHLHLGLRLIKKSATGWRYHVNTPRVEVLNYNNGFKGAVDPLDYFLPPNLWYSRVIKYASRHQSATFFEFGQLLREINV